MSEFEFLEKMFRRLSEARHHRAADEKRMKENKTEWHSAFETAELMVKYSIIDYLEHRAALAAIKQWKDQT